MHALAEVRRSAQNAYHQQEQTERLRGLQALALLHNRLRALSRTYDEARRRKQRQRHEQRQIEWIRQPQHHELQQSSQQLAIQNDTQGLPGPNRAQQQSRVDAERRRSDARQTASRNEQRGRRHQQRARLHHAHAAQRRQRAGARPKPGSIGHLRHRLGKACARQQRRCMAQSGVQEHVGHDRSRLLRAFNPHGTGVSHAEPGHPTCKSEVFEQRHIVVKPQQHLRPRLLPELPLAPGFRHLSPSVVRRRARPSICGYPSTTSPPHHPSCPRPCARTHA